MVLVQNKYKNTLVGVLKTEITFVMQSSPLCCITLRTQVIRLNSGNLDPQKTTQVFLLLYSIKPLTRNPSCLVKSPGDLIFSLFKLGYCDLYLRF